MTLTEVRFPGSEIKEFLHSELVKSYHHRVRADVEEINFNKLSLVRCYDLRDNSFGYFVSKDNEMSEVHFLDLFRDWLAEKNEKDLFDAWLGKQIGEEKLLAVSEIRSFVISGFLPTLSSSQLSKILEVIREAK